MAVKTGIEVVHGTECWSAQIWVGLRVTDHAANGSYFEHSLNDVRESCQDYVDVAGWCVTVTPTDYIYTNGSEHGAVIGAISYPRFQDVTSTELRERVLELAKKLLVDLHQTFVTVVIHHATMHETVMVTDHDRFNLNERNRDRD